MLEPVSRIGVNDPLHQFSPAASDYSEYLFIMRLQSLNKSTKADFIKSSSLTKNSINPDLGKSPARKHHKVSQGAPAEFRRGMRIPVKTGPWKLRRIIRTSIGNTHGSDKGYYAVTKRQR